MSATAETALDWYFREWHAIPQMPTSELWKHAMDRLHAIAAAKFGDAAALEAWGEFRRRKGWPE
jgi:hypothetical protein